jgi:hypothetical protein
MSLSADSRARPKKKRKVKSSRRNYKRSIKSQSKVQKKKTSHK